MKRLVGISGPLLLLCIMLFAHCGKQENSPPQEKASGKDKATVIGVSLMNLSSEFIVMIDHAIEAKAKALGVVLIANDAQRSPERQVQQVESFIAQKRGAVILHPCGGGASLR